MTVASSLNRADLVIASGTTDYPFSFRIFEDADLAVVRLTAGGIEVPLVLNTDYTVTGVGDYNGGNVVLSGDYAASHDGEALTIRRVLELTQEVSIRNQAKFYPETHEDVFDRLTMIDQQQEEQIGRAFKLPVTTTGVSAELPVPVAGRGLKWNGDASALVNSDSDPDTIATAAAGSAAAAAISAGQAADALLATQGIYDNFDDRYLGPKGSDPAADNDGNALLDGALYWKTTAPKGMRVYDADAGAWGDVAASISFTPVQFSGDGTTGPFELPFAPKSKNNVSISIGGTNQHKSAFDVVGTELTFTEATPVGEEIEAVLVSVLPIASADAANVQYDGTTLDLILKNRLGAVVSSIAGLKTLDKTKHTKACSVGYYADGDGGGGFYYLDAADTTSADNGGTIIVATDGGRWKLAHGDRVTAKQFGVKTDGTNAAGNLVALQAAVNWCADNLKVLELSPSNVSSVIALAGTLSITKPLRMIGSGSNNVTIQGSGLAAGEYLIDVDGTAFGTYERGEFSGMTLMPGAGAHCMRVKDVSASAFSDIGVRNCASGLVITGTRAFSNRFERIVAITSVSASTIAFSSYNGGGQLVFDTCSFGGDTGFAVDSASAMNNLVLNSCNFESCSTNQLSITGTVKGMSMTGCRTEAGGGAISFVINPATGNSVEGMSITGSFFHTSAEQYAISLGGAGGGVRGFNIAGNYMVGYTGAFVRLNGDGESGLVTGNYVDRNVPVVNMQRAGVVVFGNENSAGKSSEYWGSANWGVSQGTFTLADGSGAGLTLATGSGVYTRIGRLVFWQANVVYPTTSNSASAVLSGLPFTIVSKNGSAGRAGGSISATDSVVTGFLQMENTATIWLEKAGIVRATNAEMSGKSLYLSGVYTAE